MTALRASTEAGVGRLVFDRPEALNALTPATLEALIEACQGLGKDEAVRLVILEGAGENFSAGADLPAFFEAFGQGSPRSVADLGRRAAHALAELPQITLALIQGHCVGGGLVMAGACDLRVAAENARFLIPELDAGIPLGWGGLERLTALVGETVAVDWVLSCRPFEAREALEKGFLTRVVATDRFLPESRELVDTLLRRPAVGLRATKRQLQQLRSGRYDPRGDADALLAAMADPEAQAVGQGYVKAKIQKDTAT